MQLLTHVCWIHQGATNLSVLAGSGFDQGHGAWVRNATSSGPARQLHARAIVCIALHAAQQCSWAGAYAGLVQGCSVGNVCKGEALRVLLADVLRVPPAIPHQRF